MDWEKMADNLAKLADEIFKDIKHYNIKSPEAMTVAVILSKLADAIRMTVGE